MILFNFAGRDYRLIDRLRKLLLIAIVFLAAGAGILVSKAIALRTDLDFLNRAVNNVEAVRELAPVLAERDRVVRDLNAMSGLTESRRFSWTRLLTSIETVFPVGVALSKIEYVPRDKAVIMEGSARSPESLASLMVALEKSRYFRQPYLKHQTVDKGSIFFNVTGFYQENKAAAGAEGQ